MTAEGGRISLEQKQDHIIGYLVVNPNWSALNTYTNEQH